MIIAIRVLLAEIGHRLLRLPANPEPLLWLVVIWLVAGVFWWPSTMNAFAIGVCMGQYFSWTKLLKERRER